MAELSVKIGADVKGLLTALDSVQSKVSETSGTLKKLITNNDRVSNSINTLSNEYKSGAVSEEVYKRNLERLEKLQQRYTKLIPQTEKNLTRLNKQYKQLGGGAAIGAKGIQKLDKSTKGAVPTLTSFSQVIQDAPYGIRGVANNITQLTSQFGYLSKNAGGSKAALKAMLGTLTGPAGILLAVSAITSLMVSYGDSLDFTTGITGKLAKATADYTGSAKAEILALNQLLSIAKDENKSKDVRNGALKEINKNYSKYLGNLDLESLKTDKVKESIDRLTKSLLIQAKIKGVADLIEEESKSNAEDLISLDLKRQKVTQKIVDLKKAIAESDSGRDEFINKRSLGAAENQLSRIDSDIKDINESANEVLKPFLKLQKTLKETDFEIGGTNVKPNTKPSGKPVLSPLDKDKAYAERKRKLFDKLENDIRKEEDESVKNFISNWEKVDLDIDPFDGDLIDIESGFQDVIALETKIKEIDKLLNSLGVDTSQINLEGLNIERLDSFQSKLEKGAITSDIFSDAVGSSMSALSSQLANSFQTGNAVIDAFTSSLISSIAQLAAAGIQGLITDQIIGTAKNQINRGISSGNAITVATSAAAALGPAGVVALPGLIATQLALVNGAFAGVGSFAKGGFSGDDNLAFLNKNELVLRPFEQAALFNVLKGSGLSGVGNNVQTSASNEIIGETILRGTNQVVQYRRANKKMKRRGSA